MTDLLHNYPFISLLLILGICFAFSFLIWAMVMIARGCSNATKPTNSKPDPLQEYFNEL